MPLNTLRLNQKKAHPNDRIVFIKPLDGPDKATSQDFLNRLAAICVPIMRSHYLSVTTLEEYEPNREFWGRNFNAGECIQLVLKSPRNGRWLPFRFVAVVLMHELAHNEQMNHGKDFWKTNNRNKEELKELWSRGYTGEGMWGRGRSLYDGQLADETPLSQEDMPENLCGGTYRSRRKRPRKPKLSYQEQKERRIKRKFGEGGVALGEDEVQRRYLENGKFAAGRPRVAQSKRGRELRANALLDRLEREKSEMEAANRVEISDDGSETEGGADGSDDESEAAHDRDGSLLMDSKGHSMVRVCEEEPGAESADAQHEMDELRSLDAWLKPKAHAAKVKSLPDKKSEHNDPGTHTSRESDTAQIQKPPSIKKQKITCGEIPKIQPPVPVGSPSRLTKLNTPASSDLRVSSADQPVCSGRTESLEKAKIVGKAASPEQQADQACAVCSLLNSTDALICMACANVLDTARMPRYWHCKSESCRQSGYINPEDAGVCGLCGAKRDIMRL